MICIHSSEKGIFFFFGVGGRERERERERNAVQEANLHLTSYQKKGYVNVMRITKN
jgi:hypothetical protein